jgi:hypothetical protein
MPGECHTTRKALLDGRAGRARPWWRVSASPRGGAWPRQVCCADRRSRSSQPTQKLGLQPCRCLETTLGRRTLCRWRRAGSCRHPKRSLARGASGRTKTRASRLPVCEGNAPLKLHQTEARSRATLGCSICHTGFPSLDIQRVGFKGDTDGPATFTNSPPCVCAWKRINPFEADTDGRKMRMTTSVVGIASCSAVTEAARAPPSRHT